MIVKSQIPIDIGTTDHELLYWDATSSTWTKTGANLTWNNDSNILGIVGGASWGDGSAASILQTFANTGTNTTMTASSALMAFSHTVQAKDLILSGVGTGQSTITVVNDFGADPVITLGFLSDFPDTLQSGTSFIAQGTSNLLGAVTIGIGQYRLPTVKGTIGHLVTQTSAGDPDRWDYVNPATLSVALAAAVTVTNSTDETSFIAMFDSATGNLPIRTETGLTYNSATQSLGIGGDLGVTGKGIFGQEGSTFTTLSVGTDSTKSNPLNAQVEIISNPANPLQNGLVGGLHVESANDVTVSGPSQKVAGIFFEVSEGDVSGAINSIVALFGGAITKLTNTDAVAGTTAGVTGLSFTVANRENWTPTNFVGVSTIITTGIKVTADLGADGFTISGLSEALNCGALFTGRMFGAYNAVEDGENCAIKAITTDSLTTGSGDIVSYGVFIDACASSADIGGGGVLTSWGLYEANGRNNALLGNTRIGSLGIPTSLLHVGDGTNELQVSATGDLLFLGTATVFNDIFISLSSAKVPAANAPSWTSFIGNLKQYTYGLNDFQEFSAEIDHSYKQGSDIEFHIHGATNGQEGSDKTIKFEVEYEIVNNNTSGSFGDAYTGTTIMEKEIIIPSGTPDKTAFSIDVGIDDTGAFLQGASVVGRIRRIASTGTEPVANPFVIQLGLHIEEDTVGSRTEMTK